jgi:hypothetical protein
MSLHTAGQSAHAAAAALAQSSAVPRVARTERPFLVKKLT